MNWKTFIKNPHKSKSQAGTESTNLVLTCQREGLVCGQRLGCQIFEEPNQLTERQASNNISKGRVEHRKGLRREHEDSYQTHPNYFKSQTCSYFPLIAIKQVPL